ncbi:hypothetical protein GCM10010172_19940 [Paractinoplanes ferrugineus]|uniref:non-specific serine/threonine protein kinase n=1 Tax=Paractinoplanes ferrugineus TaxID=113564 RepID=A0A919MDT0_9ACTN|nr:serine/threonine-protein kinase [Actinoplanes ferrugineus]GIE12063.1 hypothetical protein Afe05nite_39030 [Actinoplanes ferrugineus]
MTKDRMSGVVRADSAGTSATDLGGRCVGSSYVLQHPIGQGATGTVWRGVERGTGEPVAVKLLHESLLRQPKLVTRFVQERTILLMLRHRNVVRVRDLFSVGETLGLVMDLVDGGSLRDHLRENGTVAPGEACRFAAQVASALAEAHELGVIHRDLKPDNVLLQVQGGGLDTRLTDFGVARILNTASMTTPDAVVGTPHYMAPEAFHGVKASAATDVYALGVLLYELVSGHPPYESDSIPHLMRRHLEGHPVRRAGIPDVIWELIEDCMATEPRLRPSAAELVAALSDAAGRCAEVPALPRPEGHFTEPGSAYADDSAFYPNRLAALDSAGVRRDDDGGIGWRGLNQAGPGSVHAGGSAPGNRGVNAGPDCDSGGPARDHGSGCGLSGSGLSGGATGSGGRGSGATGIGPGGSGFSGGGARGSGRTGGGLSRGREGGNGRRPGGTVDPESVGLLAVPLSGERGAEGASWRWVKRPGAMVTLVAGVVAAVAVAATAWDFGPRGGVSRDEVGSQFVAVGPTRSVGPSVRVPKASAPRKSAHRAAADGHEQRAAADGHEQRAAADGHEQRGSAAGPGQRGSAAGHEQPGSAAARVVTPSGVPSKAAAPSVTETRSPQPEATPYGSWKCGRSIEFDVRGRTPFVLQPCQMSGRDVRYQALLTAPGGGIGSITVSLREVSSGRTVAGPTTCANLEFDGDASTRGCDPVAAQPEKGYAYQVVMTYRYERQGRTVASSAKGSAFTW